MRIHRAACADGVDLANIKWPFDGPENAAAATTASVVRLGAPILLVQHLAEGEGWSFLDGEPFDIADGMLISMRHVVDIDPTVAEVSDLPEGWLARRERIGAPWTRERDDA
jgi:hypothetical protein